MVIVVVFPFVAGLFGLQDVAQVSLASVLLRAGFLDDAAVVIRSALEVRLPSFSETPLEQLIIETALER